VIISASLKRQSRSVAWSCSRRAIGLTELVELLLRDGGRAAVRPRANQYSGRQLSVALELLQPELHALERLLAIAGVEQHQRGRDVLQKDRVHLAVDVLAR
jgi:hypothetical protein